MVAAAPVLDPGLIGAVRITKDIQSVNDAVRRTTISLVSVIGGIGLVIGLVIAFIVSGSLARPLTRLAATARRLGAGDLSARAHDVSGADEIEELAGSFDEMADRVERTVQAQREFVANASHQLRTPLTGMKLRLESAIERSDSPEMTHDLTAADKEIDRLAATVDRLLVMARTLEEGGSTEIELHDAAERAADRWRERAATTRSTLSVDGDPVTAQANATDVDQILDNLLENAMTYAPGADRACRPARPSAGRSSRFAITDRASRPRNRRKVTERFYRGKTAPPGGSGLGLAIARDLAERWGGALSVQSADGGGTRVEVRFRVASGAGQQLATTGGTRDADPGATVGRSRDARGRGRARCGSGGWPTTGARGAGLADLQPGAELLRARRAVLGGVPAPRRSRWSRSHSPGAREATRRSIGSTARSGVRLHEEKEEMSPELVRACAAAAGMPDLVDRAIAIPELADEVRQEFLRRPTGERVRRADARRRGPAGGLRAGLRARSGRRRGRGAVGTHLVADRAAGLLRDEAMAA